MNNERRGQLAKQLENLETVKDKVEDILAKVDGILDEEKDARDNYPENLMGSEAYERSDEACDNLSEAVDRLTDAVDSLEDAISSIEAATD